MNTTRNAGEVGAALLMACMARAPSSPESRRRPGITNAEKTNRAPPATAAPTAAVMVRARGNPSIMRPSSHDQRETIHS